MNDFTHADARRHSESIIGIVRRHLHYFLQSRCALPRDLALATRSSLSNNSVHLRYHIVRTMFRWLVPLLLMLSSPCQASNGVRLLVLSLSLSTPKVCLATTYGSSCGSDSSCDAHQKCVSAVCRCNPNERRFWTGIAHLRKR